MKLLEYNKLYNFVGYQAIWFIAILGREQFEWLLLTLIALHVYFCKERIIEAKALALCSAIGIAVDTVLTWTGIFIFSPTPTLLPIPLWLVDIWIGFAATLRHSLSYLIGRPFIGVALAAIGAPLSYLAGMKLGAVEFGLSSIDAALLIGVLWCVMMPVFLTICRMPLSNRLYKEETEADQAVY